MTAMFGDDFERDTRIIREWLKGGAVPTKELVGELAAWARFMGRPVRVESLPDEHYLVEMYALAVEATDPKDAVGKFLQEIESGARLLSFHVDHVEEGMRSARYWFRLEGGEIKGAGG